MHKRMTITEKRMNHWFKSVGLSLSFFALFAGSMGCATKTAVQSINSKEPLAKV